MIKAWLVARREFVDHLTTTTFWIGILTVPLVLGLSIGFSIFLKKMQLARNFAIVDQSQWLWAAVEAQIFRDDLPYLFAGLATGKIDRSRVEVEAPELRPLTDQLKNLPLASIKKLGRGGTEELASIDFVPFEPSLMALWRELTPSQAARISDQLSASRFKRVSVSATQPDQLDDLVADGSLSAYVFFPPDPLVSRQNFRFVSRDDGDLVFLKWMEGHVDRALRSVRLRVLGVNSNDIQAVVETFRFSRTTPLTEGGVDPEGKPWGPLAFAFLLWISVYKISKMLLTVTLEEKSNSMIEILLSSVTPLELMTGKVLGMAGAGLTMILLWSGFSLVSLQVFQSFSGSESTWLSFADQPVFVFSFVVYFLLGYLFYAALLAGLGSVCDNVKAAQTLSMSVNALLFFPLFVIGSVAQDPHGQLARFLSFVPPFTPFVMMARATGPPAVWEYLVSGVGLLLAIVVAFWAAARVFRIGILRTGKPPKLIEILAWLGKSKSEKGALNETPDSERRPT